MAWRADDLVTDPAIVVVSKPSLTPEEWLEAIRWPEPLALSVTGAELVAEARAENE